MKIKNNIKYKKGFTLIEILVVIGIIAVLAGVVLVAINPSRQFKLARDSQRVSNVNAILNTISQNIAEHKGLFMCGQNVMVIPVQVAVIRSGNAQNTFDIASCVIPSYISSLPFDPSAQGAHFTDSTDYDTQYSVVADNNGRVSVSAVGEITPVISVTR
jgi:type IV pilus assembly protein PilA